jgi:hypothetical protein
MWLTFETDEGPLTLDLCYDAIEGLHNLMGEVLDHWWACDCPGCRARRGEISEVEAEAAIAGKPH